MNHDPHVSGENSVVYAQIGDENDVLNNNSAAIHQNPMNQDVNSDHQNNFHKPSQSQYAQPSYHQPVFVQSTVYAQPHAVAERVLGMQRPLPNRWADSICDWPNNLFPSCYCACCCFQGMYIVAQSENM